MNRPSAKEVAEALRVMANDGHMRVVAAELKARTAEREEARAWVRHLTAADRVLTCAFCGEPYPPGTPTNNDEALTAHVKVCTKHPMRKVEAERDEMKRIAGEALDGWEDALNGRHHPHKKARLREQLVKVGE